MIVLKGGIMRKHINISHRYLILNRPFIVLLAYLCLIQYSLYGINSAISYNFNNCGRFGDHMVVYCKAKYLSLKTGLPLFFRNFSATDHFTMHYTEKHYSQDMKFNGYMKVHSRSEINPQFDGILFMVDIFTSTGEPYIQEEQFLPSALPMRMNFYIDELYQRMQQDDDFKNTLKQMLRPISTTNIFQINSEENTISVAVHVRKSSYEDRPLFSKQLYTRDEITELQNFSGMDHKTEYSDIQNPLRFPPEQYYIDQINKLSTCLSDKKLYIQLFTDYNNPEELLQRFKQFCQGANCTISLGTTGPWQDAFVQDVFKMAYFDCLIRSSSHFPGISQLIGNHKLIISPKNYKWIKDRLVITETNIVVNDDKFKALLDTH